MKVYPYKFSESALLLVVLILPSLIVFQPLIGGFTRTSILLFWNYLLPLLLAFYYRERINWILILLLLILILANSYDGLLHDTSSTIRNILYILFSIILFRVGASVSNEKYAAQIWTSIIKGVTVANLIMLFIYLGVFFGFIDLDRVYEPFLRSEDPEGYGLTRFSIGNAIEVPLMLTSLLAVSLYRHRSFSNFDFFAVLINLILATIAQSRIVFLIALLLFLTQLRFKPFRLAVLASISVIAVYSFDFFGEFFIIIESLLGRFTGEDDGTASERLTMLYFIFSKIEASKIFFGNGILSSTILQEIYRGEYRTVESTFLQIIYELGVVGISLIFFLLFSTMKKNFYRIEFSIHSLIYLLIWGQVLFLVPFFATIIFIMFSLGAYSGNRFNLNS